MNIDLIVKYVACNHNPMNIHIPGILSAYLSFSRDQSSSCQKRHIGPCWHLIPTDQVLVHLWILNIWWRYSILLIPTTFHHISQLNPCPVQPPQQVGKQFVGRAGRSQVTRQLRLNLDFHIKANHYTEPCKIHTLTISRNYTIKFTSQSIHNWCGHTFVNMK